MDLKNLTTFIAVAELRSFTGAAVRLGYTQSTVSTQIRQMENELGVQLFERVNHTVTLTEPGRKFLQSAHKINALLTEAVRDEAAEANGPVRLAMADSLCSYLSAGVLPRLRMEYPGITLKITTAGTEEMFRLLGCNEADLVYTLDSHIYDHSYVILRENQVGVHFVAPSNHPLARAGRVLAVEDLICQPFILTEKGMSYRKLLDEALARSSLEITPVLEIGNTDLICSLVEQGVGLSFLPDYATRRAAAAGKIIRLEVGGFDLEVWAQLLTHRDKWISKPMGILIDLLSSVET